LIKVPARGYVYGFTSYLIWGLFPLYWPLLEPASAWETLAHRITWSLLFLAILNTVRNDWNKIGAVLKNRRQFGLLTGASILITINWGLYIWAVFNDHVIDASLGYFMNPIINIAFGVVLFREKLRKMQWFAIAIAAGGVISLVISTGQIPWVALILGFSFGSYGMLKKLANVDAVESLTVETLILVPFAVSYLVYLFFTNQIALGHHGVSQTTFTLLAGVVTAIPLLLFGAAAVRIPYSAMGIMQYVTPTMQFLCGYFITHEPMTSGRWIGFGFVWIALAVYSVDAITHHIRFAQSEE
jgi:chloramphenicol-sensitive protein RarD